MPKIFPCLRFDAQAEAAANFHVSVLPDSRILGVQRYGRREAAALRQPAINLAGASPLRFATGG